VQCPRAESPVYFSPVATPRGMVAVHGVSPFQGGIVRFFNTLTNQYSIFPLIQYSIIPFFHPFKFRHIKMLSDSRKWFIVHQTL
jgi:hypothetical protein